jgi:acetylornithine/N-succinyldiaminopimelate aminotransferase
MKADSTAASAVSAAMVSVGPASARQHRARQRIDRARGLQPRLSTSTQATVMTAGMAEAGERVAGRHQPRQHAGQQRAAATMSWRQRPQRNIEANEAAIKVARKYGHDRGVAEPAIIVMEKAFHGRSLATLSATGSRKVQAGFEPLVQGFVRVPLNDLDAVRQVAEHNKNVVAVFVEPIQGEGGINVSRLEYLRGLKEICDQNEWLFMSDEVQCGLGRTGKWFVYQHAGIQPDVVPLAKGLASGVPVGACVVGGRAKGVFKPGNHGSTFGGNPLAMCGVVTTLDTMKDEGLLENAVKVGDAIRGGLEASLAGVPGLVEVRGMGLMIGVELDRPCGEIVTTALERGLVVNVTADRVIRILPPLVMSETEGREVVERLAPIVREFLAQPADAAHAARAAAAR